MIEKYKPEFILGISGIGLVILSAIFAWLSDIIKSDGLGFWIGSMSFVTILGGGILIVASIIKTLDKNS